MLDFVLDYPKKHKNAAAKSIGDDFVTGEIPALIQWDERWGYAPYGSETIIAVSGCGPTALSMVISGLLQDASITPAVVADYASSNGYLDENLDTKWELMTNGVEHFGLSGSILGLDENAMNQCTFGRLSDHLQHGTWYFYHDRTFHCTDRLSGRCFYGTRSCQQSTHFPDLHFPGDFRSD